MLKIKILDSNSTNNIIEESVEIFKEFELRRKINTGKLRYLKNLNYQERSTQVVAKSLFQKSLKNFVWTLKFYIIKQALKNNFKWRVERTIRGLVVKIEEIKELKERLKYIEDKYNNSCHTGIGMKRLIKTMRHLKRIIAEMEDVPGYLRKEREKYLKRRKSQDC